MSALEIVAKTAEVAAEVAKETAKKGFEASLEKAAEFIPDFENEDLSIDFDDSVELPDDLAECADEIPDFDLPEQKADGGDIDLKGGAYKDLPDREGFEKHHMPADSTTELSFRDGPSIIMEKAEHRQTASCGNWKEAKEYRETQSDLVKEGKFEEAFQMDVDDIRSKFGDKYDEAITQAEKYIDELKSKGALV